MASSKWPNGLGPHFCKSEILKQAVAQVNQLVSQHAAELNGHKVPWSIHSHLDAGEKNVNF